MNVETAYALSEHEGKPESRRSTERWEIAQVIVLAIVAVATAWSGYQAAKWDGRQALDYGNSTRLRIEADEASTLGGQQRLLDVSTFNTWIQAHQDGDEQLAAIYEKRFSPEYKVAFDAWLETHPFSNPNAPPGPTFMPEYHNAQSERASELNEEAAAVFEDGTKAREIADRYVRHTVLFATVLFLLAIAQRFQYRAVRLTASGLAVGLMVVAMIGVLALPRL